MWPTSVAIPVAVTTNSPAPRVTLVFMYTMSVRSPSGVPAPATGSVPLATGRLSPVSADSPASSVAAFSSRPSAGHDIARLDRDDVAGNQLPGGDLRQLAVPPHPGLDDLIFCRAATAAAAFPSCCRPMTALNSVSRISRMPVPSCLSG